MNEELNQPKGKTWLWIILVVIVLAGIAYGGWYFFIKKSIEGEACNTNSKCESGLNCANKVCSSGKTGSSCSAKSDCQTNYCVSGKCTNGTVGDACSTYKDCGSGLYCKTGACTTPPDYSKYFSKVVISRIDPGSGPSTNNPATVTSTFTTADALEIDFTGVNPTTVGEFYYEIADSTSGEISRSSKNEQTLNFSGRDIGTGTSLDNVALGTYDLNIYFKDELVYTTQIIVTN